MEHFIYLVQSVSNYNLRVKQCDDGLVIDHWKHYFRAEYNHVFSVFQFNMFIAIIIMVIQNVSFEKFNSIRTDWNWFVRVKWISIVMAIVWNYSDVFIITVGIALSTRFKQLNNRIYSSDGMVRNKFSVTPKCPREKY